MTVHTTRLENGLRIVSENRPNLQTVAVGVWVKAGTRNEPEHLNGITHCLEHMLFKGTERRSARDIAFEIEAVGGHMNAYTTRDNTTYYARVLKDDLPLALDVLSDILLNSVIDKRELEREKEVILQEIGQAMDTPDDIIFDHLQAVSYKDQPLGRSILGTPDIVRSYSADDLHSYLADRYTASNLVISAVGNLDHDTLVAMVEEKFAAVRAGKPASFDPAVYVGGTYSESRKLEQVHLTHSWPSASYHDDDYYAYQIYSTILGGGMSSRLFQEVRENRGLAYSVYSFTSSHDDTGLFGIYAGTGPEMIGEMAPVVLQEVAKMAEGISVEEFNIALTQLRAGLMMALEATTSRMEQLGRQILVFDRIISTDEMLSNIKAVNISDVDRVAKVIAGSNSMSTAIIGGDVLN